MGPSKGSGPTDSMTDTLQFMGKVFSCSNVNRRLYSHFWNYTRVTALSFSEHRAISTSKVTMWLASDFFSTVQIHRPRHSADECISEVHHSLLESDPRTLGLRRTIIGVHSLLDYSRLKSLTNITLICDDSSIFIFLTLIPSIVLSAESCLVWTVVYIGDFFWCFWQLSKFRRLSGRYKPE